MTWMAFKTVAKGKKRKNFLGFVLDSTQDGRIQDHRSIFLLTLILLILYLVWILSQSVAVRSVWKCSSSTYAASFVFAFPWPVFWCVHRLQLAQLTVIKSALLPPSYLSSAISYVAIRCHHKRIKDWSISTVLSLSFYASSALDLGV